MRIFDRDLSCIFDFREQFDVSFYEIIGNIIIRCFFCSILNTIGRVEKFRMLLVAWNTFDESIEIHELYCI
jgi:hypothetical protein